MPPLSPGERERGAAFAAALTIRPLTMAWQILLKGLQEVQSASRPRIAAEMVLIRLPMRPTCPDRRRSSAICATGMLVPMQAVAAACRGWRVHAPRASIQTTNARDGRTRAHRAWSLRAARRSAPRSRGSRRLSPRISPQSFEAVVALAETKRDIRLQMALTRDVASRVFERGGSSSSSSRMEVDLPNRLLRALLDWTGHRWGVTVVDAPPGPLPPTLMRRRKKSARKSGVACRTTARRAGDPQAFSPAHRSCRSRKRARPPPPRPRPSEADERRISPSRIQRRRSLIAREQSSDMRDIMGMMKEMAGLKTKMEAMQAELDETLVEGQSGAGSSRSRSRPRAR